MIRRYNTNLKAVSRHFNHYTILLLTQCQLLKTLQRCFIEFIPENKTTIMLYVGLGHTYKKNITVYVLTYLLYVGV